MAYTFNFELSGGINIYRQTDSDTPVLYETWSPKAKVKIRVTDTTLSIIPIPASVGSERSEFYLKEAGGSSNNIFQIGGVTETGGLTVFAKRLTSEVFLDAGSGASTTLYNTLAGNSGKSDGAATPNYVSLYVASVLPLEYVALISQTAGNDPVVTVLNGSSSNYLGDIVWTRSTAGFYVGALANAFPDGKVFCTPQYFNPQSDFPTGVYLQRTTDGTVSLTTIVTPDLHDTMLDKTPILIRVYP